MDTNHKEELWVAYKALYNSAIKKDDLVFALAVLDSTVRLEAIPITKREDVKMGYIKDL